MLWLRGIPRTILQLRFAAAEREGTEADDPATYEAYFDENGDPCESTFGSYARAMVWEGPHKNILAEERYLDANGDPDTSISSGAYRVLIPMNLCDTYVAGVTGSSAEMMADALEHIRRLTEKEKKNE